ncbi:NupC/NupG family nucleoside CNT transporter [Erythrobacter sp. YT30]|uniref:NupC/NupG family nucleoside CNT transporter n=1 Tax=Erythrobacter sp. YT30 TaxID=1735012 RepID=UPI00076CDCAD|nr:nucleoside transporter C-terminal domain-containing protein [Erythrobacter sp. YT30]KWV90921.1 nucleoside:proton symporter [Erythrobacter sp. YT30]
MELFDQLRGIIGIAVLLGIAWALSEDRGNRPTWQWIAGALAMQAVLALIIVRVPFIWSIMKGANAGVEAISDATVQGSSYMFGYLGGAPLPFVLKEGTEPPVIIAFQILPLVIVFSALAALLWHWGVLRWLVNGLSFALQRTLGVSGVVGLSGGANLFLGVVESPLVVRAYFARMSRAELFQVMTLTMASISGAVLVLYASTLQSVLGDGASGHLISASLVSLPAALLIARLMVPGDSEAKTETSEDDEPGLSYASSIDAIVKGTMDGMQLFLAVIAIIIVVFALVALGDQILAAFPVVDGEPLSIKRIFGWIFAPFMWLLGVPWAEAQAAGSLMGTKAILNEYVAFLELAALEDGMLSPRGLLIVTYALCGFANLASIGLLVSTIGTLCPERRAEAAGLGIKSWITGNIASAMTGAWIGLVTFAV